MKTEQPLIVPRALLFDMDGTLTEPMLDFPLIKREMQIGAGPILEALAEMGGGSEAWHRAMAILTRHETAAAERSALNPGCSALFELIARLTLPTALITRNSAASVETFVRRHGLRIDVLISRDDAPPKPDPAPLRLACERLNVSADDVWMIGDGQYDIEEGLAAGICTVWISHGNGRGFAAEPGTQRGWPAGAYIASSRMLRLDENVEA